MWRTVEEEPSAETPASFLQNHPHTKLVVDLAVADAPRTRMSMPWKVTSCEWTDKLTRRAIVWLCHQTGKPILKLTDKDYTDRGLESYSPSTDQATTSTSRYSTTSSTPITGWPGGKPNADDTYRPERANPYPKRVIVFSPHPDDDVISMGGTLKRLVDQKHDVHVAYETSGNIAVGDEDMMRYVMLMDGIADKFGINTPDRKTKSAEIRSFVAKKAAGDMDTPTSATSRP